MKIAIDIDGVLLDTIPTLNDFYNRMHGTEFRVGDYRHHDLEKTWGGSKEYAVGVVEEFFKSPDVLKIMPMPYSREGIAVLSRSHELFSITSRPESMRVLTENFLRKNFNTFIERVIYTGQYVAAASEMDKGRICIAEGADLLIEDCLEIALNAANTGLDVFLFNNSHNQLNGNYAAIPPRLLRIKGGWQEIVERLK
ncbi:MAG TPA: hypothetical protein VJ142_01465 [Candidatus Nanoarchaeia archaeon]|nr:hypothetical protein [Candidatus Nanoarchaeia archaeon]